MQTNAHYIHAACIWIIKNIWRILLSITFRTQFLITYCYTSTLTNQVLQGSVTDPRMIGLDLNNDFCWQRSLLKWDQLHHRLGWNTIRVWKVFHLAVSSAWLGRPYCLFYESILLLNCYIHFGRKVPSAKYFHNRRDNCFCPVEGYGAFFFLYFLF